MSEPVENRQAIANAQGKWQAFWYIGEWFSDIGKFPTCSSRHLFRHQEVQINFQYPKKWISDIENWFWTSENAPILIANLKHYNDVIMSAMASEITGKLCRPMSHHGNRITDIEKSFSDVKKSFSISENQKMSLNFRYRKTELCSISEIGSLIWFRMFGSIVRILANVVAIRHIEKRGWR